MRAAAGPGRRRKGSGGYTLLEVLFSIILTAVIVSSVMTVMVSVKQGDAKSDRRLVAAQAARELDGILKAFQRDYSTSDTGTISGPNTARAGVDRWRLTGMPSMYGTINDPGDPFALAPGEHILTGFLPGWFEASPYNGRIKYTVTGALGTAQQIDIEVNWDEP